MDIWYPARPDEHADFEANPQIGAPANIASSNAVRHPLVIFSPGLGASPIGDSIFLAELAKRGFVVVAAEHDDCSASSSCRLMPDQTARRPDDIESVLDHVLILSDGDDPILKNLVDPDRIGLAGQSLGGWTALTVLQQTDPRFKAGLLINPATLPAPRPDPVHVSKPTLFMAGELDREAAFSVTQEFFEQIPTTAPDHYLLIVPRAGHEFQNRCEGALVTVSCADVLPQTRLLEIEGNVATAFLMRYLVGDMNSGAALDPSMPSPDYSLVADIRGAAPARIPTILPSAKLPALAMPTPSAPEGTVLVRDAEEHLVTTNNLALASTPLPGVYADSALGVDVWAPNSQPGDFVSVACREQPSGDGYEFIVLPESGVFVIQRRQQNEAAQLIASRISSAFQPGDKNNHLEFNCRGTLLSASINGTEVATASDNTFGEGYMAVGLGTLSSQQGQRNAIFRDLVITQL
jgi:predicted dienelactone hydrolase